MLESITEFELFDQGILYFNANQYKQAHREWEHLWKIIGNHPRRHGLKVFLQLTGIYQNIQLEKWDAVRYGIRIARQRLSENIVMLKALVEVDNIDRFLSVYKDKNISLKAFDELRIQRKGGRVHKDLGTK
ncbi:MAG: DUF309 domain-containing protein [Candidatus Marinimicrobia bacterium]|nr:DUF309 domain-containing protein [Candidatus Neomarinimicrobiota bacterium]MBL7010113.1 DUF309 domain-containing protein [Candidatus Neomarinimicrobiota bacterium]MBL7029976.1 DUF309 domain-containing protein [Candidatus Neomarinimicrobiota bacterium]